MSHFMLRQVRGPCECKVNSTKCEGPLPLCLAATLKINTEGGMWKCSFCRPAVNKLRRSSTDDRPYNCQFDLADSIISCDKYREAWERKKDILARVFSSRRNVTLSLFITHMMMVVGENGEKQSFASTITFNKRKGSLWSLSVNVWIL